MQEIEIQEFLDTYGRSPFARWFDGLNAVAAARVTIALARLGQGNFSNVEGVGTGVYELKIDFGPGYRVYFGKDGERLVILLGGSAKKRNMARSRPRRRRGPSTNALRVARSTANGTDQSV